VNRLQAIAAMSLNRVIGDRGRIPWRLPDDFKWFKKITMDHILVMGRKTFESIGKPLPGRETVILSRAGFSFPGVRTVRELNEIDSMAQGRLVFLCGGAQIYKEYLPRCSVLYLTRVKRTMEGDAFFPRFEDQFVLAEKIHDSPDFCIERYERSQ